MFLLRYAITLWYFDGNEKEEAVRKFQEASQSNICCYQNVCYIQIIRIFYYFNVIFIFFRQLR